MDSYQKGSFAHANQNFLILVIYLSLLALMSVLAFYECPLHFPNQQSVRKTPHFPGIHEDLSLPSLLLSLR